MISTSGSTSDDAGAAIQCGGASVRVINSPDPDSVIVTQCDQPANVSGTPVDTGHLGGVTPQYARWQPRPPHRPDVHVTVRRPAENVLVVRTEHRLHVERRVQVTAEHRN